MEGGRYRVPLAYSSHMYNIISTLWVLIVEPLNDQLPVGVLADSGKGSSPVQVWIFSGLSLTTTVAYKGHAANKIKLLQTI